MKDSSMRRAVSYLTLIIVTFFSFMPEARPMDPQEKLIFHFKNTDEIEYWRIVNDGVMGGLSKSEIVFSNSNTVIFKGTVSLENNGGFASTRTIPRAYELDGYNGILLQIRGDGKKYQFRLRTDDRFDGVSYRYQFETETNTWLIIEIPFQECVPVFRGRVLKDVKPVVPEEIQQIGVLISDKQAGEFQLEIDWIKAYKK
jgi:monofunctional biosynthetic peptidoglycan transglycosylase